MTARRNFLLAVPLLAAASLATAITAPPALAQPQPTTTYLIDPSGQAAAGVFPEGVAVSGARFYVGSTTDGTIYRGDLDGNVATPFLLGGQDGRTFAVGLKADGGRLFVAGGPTGRFFAYDEGSGELRGSFLVDPPPSETQPTFLNDEAVAPDGSVYVTDSLRPVLYGIPPGGLDTAGVETLPVFLDFTGTALQYQAGFNVNGIAASPDGRYLILAQSNTGKLFRVGIQDHSVVQVQLGGESVSGDGLVLHGRTLYAVERQGAEGFIVKIQLDGNLSEGTVLERFTDPTFDDPTTAAVARDRLLVVNSQFGERAAGEAPDPFTVSSIRRP